MAGTLTVPKRYDLSINFIVSGRAGTAQAKSDIEAAYKFLTETEKIPARNIIVAGYSVGSGPSTYLACKYPVRKLVLIAPLPLLPKRYCRLMYLSTVSGMQNFSAAKKSICFCFTALQIQLYPIATA